MTDTDIPNMMGKALLLAGKVAGPVLVAVLIVGLIVSLLQAVFSVQDQALVFVPKIVVAAVVLAVGGAWMLESLHTFVIELWTSIPELIRQ